MGQFTGVVVNKLNGGLGRKNPNTDNVFALVAGMPLVGDLVANEAIKLLQLSDVEAVGVNESYDANNLTLVHHSISEIFRLSPNATIYLIPTTENKSVVDVVEDILPTIRANSDIKGLAFTGFTDTLDNIPDIVETIQVQLVNVLVDENRDIDFVLLEGKGGGGNISPTNIADLRTKNAPQVSVVIGQDPVIATLDAAYAKYAAVGSALGMLAVRKINENIGSVNIQNKPNDKKGTPDYPLTDSEAGLWVDANLSDGRNAQELTGTDIKTLTNKAYIYASSFASYGGIFFNNSPTAIDKATDFAFIENNRTWNKAKRIIRQTLIPEVKGVVKKDPQTGFIKSTVISRWQGLLNKALEQMIIDNEISGFDFYIDPKQYLNEDNPLNIKGLIVKDDIGHEFEVDLGYTQKIN